MNERDRIIKEGFPDMWYVQDRVDDNEALLCRQSDFALFGGGICICTRPRAISTDEWLKTARLLAEGFDIANSPDPQ